MVKPRPLTEYKRWKATEFRQFLLYTGPVILKDKLSHDKYLNFLTLHVSVTILSSLKYSQEFLDYSNTLLNYFVQTFVSLYGQVYSSHNIHNLLRLYEECKNFGTLDMFSAFPFENYMQSILKLLRKHDEPLAQIIRRKADLNNFHNNTKRSDNKEPKLSKEHRNGPLLDFISCLQYKKIIFENFTLKIQEPDNCCCLVDNSIVSIKKLHSL
ncbi:hypothetical protein NQ314_003937 [Rhamnusium bicolor]|uniref:Uncharacterized protein n=1 Tax=Rhamnusium bicolor TaxID=1586634 RepID=A0AAV8ZN72_9CUCU|nr:hypothetical protein NQ314_003937 [Rhamnusium bicolor]